MGVLRVSSLLSVVANERRARPICNCKRPRPRSTSPTRYGVQWLETSRSDEQLVSSLLKHTFFTPSNCRSEQGIREPRQGGSELISRKPRWLAVTSKRMEMVSTWGTVLCSACLSGEIVECPVLPLYLYGSTP
jgi:hypothetical protein